MNKILKNSNILEILIKIDANPNSSQRELAEKLKFSLGKLNYCLTELKEGGLIKNKNFSKDQEKQTLLTFLLQGVSTKTELAHKFLKKKIEEYDDVVKDNAINFDEKKISEIKYREDLIANSKNIIKKVKKNKKRDKIYLKQLR